MMFQEPTAFERGLRELKLLLGDADEATLAPYQGEDGIVFFVHDIIGIDDIAPYQEDILRAFVRERKIAIRAVHGAGKTALASWCVLWVLAVHTGDVKIPCTATTKAQLYEFLFPEIRKWALRANWRRIGLVVRDDREILRRSLTIGGTRRAFPVASDKPGNIEGAHAEIIAYVYDEAKGISAEMFNATHGAFSTGTAYAIAISTPGEPSGRFYEIHQRKPGTESWWVRHVTIDEAIAAGRVTEEWVEESKLLFGENSAEYKRRVLAEFAGDEDNTVIPLEWVEAANERWRQWEAAGSVLSGNPYLGVDPATTGKNMTATAALVGDVVPFVDYVSVDDPMKTAGRAINYLHQLAVINAPEDANIEYIARQIPAAIDANGVGAGTHKRMRELGYFAVSMIAGEKTSLTDYAGILKFANLRSALYWSVRDMLNPAYDPALALPIDDRLLHDLTVARYYFRSDGAIQVESKKDIAKRLDGRSTDGGDAVMLALFARLRGSIQLWTGSGETDEDSEIEEWSEDNDDEWGWN